jgi:hypothetical protein
VWWSSMVCVFRRVSRLYTLNWQSPTIGGFFSSPLVTLMHLQTTRSLSILITQTQRRPLKVGTPVHSLLSSFQIFMTRQFTPPAVRIIYLYLALNWHMSYRRESSLHRWGVWLGLYPIRGIAQAFYGTRRTLATNDWRRSRWYHSLC